MYLAKAEGNYIGTVLPADEEARKKLLEKAPSDDLEENYIGSLERLDEVVRIFKVDELVFCSKDLPAERITWWMSRLGPNLTYRIAPEESPSIISSSSKNLPGDLYTVQVHFAIADPRMKRFKRLLDWGLSLLVLLLAPLSLLRLRSPLPWWRKAGMVLLGGHSWVGYAGGLLERQDLPPLRKGILTVADTFPEKTSMDATTLHRLNFFYAKDYEPLKDLQIFLAYVFK